MWLTRILPRLVKYTCMKPNNMYSILYFLSIHLQNCEGFVCIMFISYKLFFESFLSESKLYTCTTKTILKQTFQWVSVKPVYKDHPREKRKVVFIGRWSLCTGSFSTCSNEKPFSRETKKCGLCRQAVFLYRWSLKRFDCIYLVVSDPWSHLTWEDCWVLVVSWTWAGLPFGER